MTDQVSQAGDQGNLQQDQSQVSLGWRAALPDDIKEHEFVKTFTKPGDFVKKALEIKTEYESLKPKLEKAIFKPDDKATDADKAAYRKAMGVPEKSDEYQFPPGKDGKVDEVIGSFAKTSFHKAGLTKEQAGIIGNDWNAFITGVEKAQLDEESRALKEAEAEIKTEWKEKFDENKNVAQSFFVKVSKRNDAKLDEESKYFQETYGNDLRAIRFIFNIAKLMGEDGSPASSQQRGGTPQVGMLYPSMQK